MKKMNKKTIILIGILVMICAIAGVSYAVWQITLTQTDDNLITSSCFQVSINDKNPITLQNTIPLTDEEGKDLTPYTFTIHNECGENALYEIKYEILNDTTFTEEEDQYIDFMFQSEEPKFLNELETIEPTLKKASRAYKVEEGYIKANETKEYELRIWLDEDVTTETGVMGKKLSSEITITARYDRGIVTSPEVELALSRCSNNIIAKIKTTGNEIESYEYQIDEEDPVIEKTNTHTFENEERGETHTVKVKITDVYGNTNEVEQTIEIPDYPTLLGKKIGTEIPIVESGSGLYEVTHCEGTIDNEELTDSQKEGLLLEEYRYAGKDPNNYITFNNETWRIIGLVNVLTTNNTVEQRVKIIRNESIGQYSWDTSSTSVNNGYGVNEWSQADLMKLLNPGYEDNQDKDTSGSDIKVNNSLYWTGGHGVCYYSYNYINKTCTFENGLNDMDQMIEEVIWNTGSNNPNGYTRPNNGTASIFYQYERSNNTGKTCSPSDDCNDDIERTTKWKGKVALMYPSDYGYASSGGSEDERTKCFNNSLNSWVNTSMPYCNQNDWLYVDQYEQTLTPSNNDTGGAHSKFDIDKDHVAGDNVSNGRYTRPTLYLKNTVKITTNDKTGNKESPYELTITE